MMRQRARRVFRVLVALAVASAAGAGEAPERLGHKDG